MGFQRQKGKKNVRKQKLCAIELVFPKKGEFIARIIKAQGGDPPRFTVRNVISDKELIVPLKKSIASGPKRQTVKEDMLVLCVPFECTTSKDLAYVIQHVYSNDDEKELSSHGYLSKTIALDQEKTTDHILFVGQRLEEREKDLDDVNIDDI